MYGWWIWWTGTDQALWKPEGHESQKSDPEPAMEHAGHCPVLVFEKHVWAAFWHSGLNFRNVSDLFRKLRNSLMDLARSLHLV